MGSDRWIGFVFMYVTSRIARSVWELTDCESESRLLRINGIRVCEPKTVRSGDRERSGRPIETEPSWTALGSVVGRVGPFGLKFGGCVTRRLVLPIPGKFDRGLTVSLPRPFLGR